MAAAGVISPEQQSVFDAAASAMMARGAQAIMLGGTDLALAYSAASAPFPLVDCAAIHVRAVVELALNPDRAGGAAG
jgi:aspartate racemase